MIYFLYIFIVFFSAIQSASVKFYNRSNNNALIFNAIKSIIACISLFFLCFSGFHFHAQTLFYGCIYGLILSISMYSGYLALSFGPISITSMVVSFSVIIPLIYGIAFCGEILNTLKIIGLIFFSISIITTNINHYPETNNKYNHFLWCIFIIITFICNGLCSVLQKMHQIQYPGKYCLEFTFFAMVSCTLIFLSSILIKLPYQKFSDKKNFTGKIFAGIAGLSMAIVNFFTIKLTGSESASLLFPAISAGAISTSLLFGIVIFKEKIRYNHIIALLFGISAIIFLKL